MRKRTALILGGVGTMGLSASKELVASEQLETIAVADADIEELRERVAEWGLPEDAAVALDARDESALRDLMATAPDVVVNALPKQLAVNVARAAVATGARVIDLNSLSPPLRELDGKASAVGAVYVAGCGASSGLTNMMAKHGARGMTEIEAIEVSIASFRSIALSPASIHGVFWEFGPDSVRGYCADGAYHRLRLWEDPVEIDFGDPIGCRTVYPLPHSEPRTLSRNLQAKRVIVRGTFTPKAMRLIRSLIDYGFFRSEPVVINGLPIQRRELMVRYLEQVPQANEEPIWDYGLHVRVTGRVSDRRVERVLSTSHPPSSELGWSGPDAWIRCVALPLVAGSLLLARGNYVGVGIDAPEAFLPAEPFLKELHSRGLSVHECTREVGCRAPSPPGKRWRRSDLP